MDTPVTRFRLIAACLILIPTAASVAIPGQQDTETAHSPGFSGHAYTAAIDAKAHSTAYDTTTGTDDPDPAPQPPPVDEPEDTQFATRGREVAYQIAAKDAEDSWQLNIASCKAHGFAIEMVGQLQAAGFDAAQEKIVRNDQQLCVSVSRDSRQDRTQQPGACNSRQTGTG